LKILEQAIQFPPQALERPPLGRTMRFLSVISHRHFGCSFTHVTSPYFARDGTIHLEYEASSGSATKIKFVASYRRP
jgi:hypothetical protein